MKIRLQRGSQNDLRLEEFEVEVEPGMVVLDAIHRIQATEAPDLAVRWNCKAGKCGSCSAEINGRPKLTCMTRLSDYPDDETLTVQPMKTFPIIKDLVTDVSWNYEQNKKIVPFNPGKKHENKDRIMYQRDIDRIQEFRKCIECYLCQDVCHVIRDQNRKDKFVGPRFMIRLASLEMHPLDIEDRIPQIKDEHGSGMCNITRCCTEVCPENIQITDNGIIPMKERVVDRFYDPMIWIYNKLFGENSKN
jgi:succinate dehydrogenase / fumarate reductase iron-sulfur subunit